MRKFLIGLACIFSLLVLPTTTHAADFKNDYNVEYFLNDTGGSIDSHVKFTVTITYNRSDIFIKNLTLSFPKSFSIANILATDSSGTLATSTEVDSTFTKVNITFDNPTSGKDNSHIFYVEFDQNNLFKVAGNVWEVMLPVINDDAKGDYQIQVHLPEHGDKKISIAKPIPDNIQGNVITWSNPQAKTIYATFGDNQYYQAQLTYHLRNSKLTPVYTEIAFPPDTTYQKIYIQSIDPPPDKVYQDQDGNYIGRYNLNPTQKKDIQFNSVIEVLAKPREEVRVAQVKALTEQKKYLTTETSFWQIPVSTKIESLKSTRDLYNFVVDSLQYDYDKLSKTSVPRMGATAVLKQPDQAVCTEFADLFIALAREKGDYAREVEGFGFSQDEYLRPLAKNVDVLHSWPEYFDTLSNIWKPVDPTWENTSGIDYFSSFDFNHIVFAIHGKDPQYPLAAGMYKFDNTQDLNIVPTNKTPEQTIRLTMKNITLPSLINDRQHYKTKLIVTNNSNVYVWNVPFEIQTKGITGTQKNVVIDSLAPYEVKEYPYEYYADVKNQKTEGELRINLLNNEVFHQSFSIVPYYYSLGLKIAYIFIPLGILFLIVTVIVKKRK